MTNGKFNITFWKLQNTGWFLFFLLMIEERFRYEDDFLSMAFIGFLIAVFGYLCSLALRWIYKKINADQWGYIAVIIVMVVSSLITGYSWADITAYYITKYDLLRPEAKPDWYRIFAWERNLIVVMFLWNSMYFGIKYWKQSLQETEKRLLAEFEKEKSNIEHEQVLKELDYKNKELMTKTMYLAKHNELLIRIAELIGDKAETDPMKNKEILQLIKKSLRIENQWKEFDLWFNDVHQDFYDRLKNNFPSLSNRELKICAFLKLKLSTKEIVDLTNLTTGTIEQYRTRLRKKLNLKEGENMQSFLDSV